MELKVYINGSLHPKSKATVSVFDHGLLYGDGAFEGIRSYAGLVFKLSEHLDRLYETAHTIMLNIPLTKQQMAQAVIKTLQVNQLRDAYIRLIVTRGPGDLGLDPRKCPAATIIIITDKIKLYPEKLYQDGMEIITVPTIRNLPEALNPQLKSLNYLNNIMAKIEAINAGCEEAIMLNSQGYIAECTGDNIFMVKKGNLSTPACHLGALKGITRGAILGLARQKGINCAESIITRHEIFNAEEVFLTGTAAEIIPVVKIDGRKIGDGKPGRVTLNLMKEFRKLTKTDGVRYPVK